MAARTNTLDKKVSNGIDFLTMTYGDDSWMGEVDTDKLDMGTMRNCILGQLYGSYDRGCDRLYITPFSSDSSEYGFHVPVAKRAWEYDKYAILTEAWKRALTKDAN